MTREEAVKVLQENLDILREYDIANSSVLRQLRQALEMAIQALEKENIYDDKEHYVTISKALYDKLNIDYEQALSQEPILDKIRVEIKHLHEWAFNREEILRIIDKYKAESEG